MPLPNNSSLKKLKIKGKNQKEGKSKNLELIFSIIFFLLWISHSSNSFVNIDS